MLELPALPAEAAALTAEQRAALAPAMVRAAREAFAARDAARGLGWLRLAAEAGHGPAMVHLANRTWATEPCAAEAWLRRAAGAGDGLAMLNLGQRLLEGLGLAPDPRAGANWLERAAATGFAPAMNAWGEYLLVHDPAEAGGWLERAAEAGFAPAMTTLAELGGAGAEAWLDRAIAKGHGRAMGLRGEALLATDPTAGRHWLQEAFRRGELHFGLALGVSFYQAGDFAAAADVFALAMRQDSPSAAINAATMARRGEWPAELSLPPVEELLEPLAHDGEPWAMVNLALYWAGKGRWDEADALMAALPPAEAVTPLVDWWQALAARGDGEGALVLGWLARHGRWDGPVASYFAEARQAGWGVPTAFEGLSSAS